MSPRRRVQGILLLLLQGLLVSWSAGAHAPTDATSVAGAGMAHGPVAAAGSQSGPAHAPRARKPPAPAGTAEASHAAKGEAQTLPIVGACPRALPLEGESDESGAIEERGAWEWQRLTYPTGQMPQGDWRGEALRYVEDNFVERAPDGVTTFPSGREEAVIAPGTTWTAMGPMPEDNATANAGYKYGLVTGRVNAVAFSGASTAYLGGPVGGLWKTTNCCSASTTWAPLWDDPNFAAQSVGAIAVDPNDPSVIYVGTGDSQPVAGDMYGNGIFKSTDGGATWTQVGASLFSPYQSAGATGTACCAQAPDENVKAIVVDPRNSSTVIAGASYGLFISYDGGGTWSQVDVVPRTAAAQRVSALLIDGNTNPSTLCVAIGYPYSSSKRAGVTNAANGVYLAAVTGSGTPTFTLLNGGSWPASDVGRIELAWNPAHTRIYAQVASYSSTNALGTFTTADGGATWTQLSGSADANYKSCAGSKTNEAQDWYDLFLAVDPLDDKTLYIGRTSLYKAVVNPTYTGFSSLTDLGSVYATGCPGYGALHPDQHGFAWVPGAGPSAFLVGCDGGAYLGTGAVGGFTQLNGTLDTMEFYSGQLGRDFANTGGSTTQYAFGGFQDNGSASWDSVTSTGGSLKWQSRGNGGDGFFASFDPLAGTLTAGRWLTEYTYGSLSCSSAGASGSYSSSCKPSYPGGDRQDWSTPFMMDQWNCTSSTCGNMVLGTTFVWASTSGGSSWTRTGTTDLTKGSGDIISLDVAHASPGSVIAGTNDGNVQWSSNVFTGVNCTAAAANTSNYFCTANSAAAWVNLTGGNAVLPNRVINGVAFDPTTNLTFYAAVGGFNTNTPSAPGHVFQGTCSTGTCSSFTWTDKTGNLPDIPFTAVAVNPNNAKQVFVGSYLGFFYTNDITFDPPLWNRYQTGMPNTRINYLAVDRGVSASPRASTTLGAFTYGRGLYATQINLPGCLSAPTGVTATPTCSGVSVSWSPVAGASSYSVVRGGACGLTQATFPGAASPYLDSTAVPGTTYAYWVVPSGACGNGPNSVCAFATATGAPGSPSAPSFSAVGCTTLTVNWSPVGGASGYDVYRSTGGSCAGAVKVNGSPVAGTSFPDGGLAAATQYSYDVVALSPCGNSPAGGCAQVITAGAPGTPLAPSAAASCSSIALSWAPAGGATSYVVLRGTDCGSLAEVGTASGTAFTDSGASPGTAYVYSIQASNGCGLSAAGPCCAPVSAPVTPASPGHPAAASSAWNSVSLSWDPVPGSTGYNVYRATGQCPQGNPAKLNASPLASPAFTDGTTAGSTTYAYVVTALNGSCESPPSTCAQVTTPSEACLAAPTFAGLASVANGGTVTCGVALSWQAAQTVCGGSVAYNVYRSTLPSFSPAPGTRLASAVTGTSFQDYQGLYSGIAYYYVVRAVDEGNGSEDTNTVTRSGVPTGPFSVSSWDDDGGDAQAAQMVPSAPWSVALSGGHSGPRVYRTGIYGPGLCASLVSPTLLPAPGARLTFWAEYDIAGVSDKGLVEASSDGGATWNPVAVDYPDVSASTGDACGYPSGTACFSRPNPAPSYSQYTAPLDAWVGQPILLRWRLSSGPGGGGAGWWVDDIGISAVQAPATCSPGPGCVPPAPPVLLSATPACGGVVLAWAPGAGTTGSYNVCRAAACGEPYVRLNPAPLQGTTFTDSTASPGATYAYVVRGSCELDGTGESDDSNCLAASQATPTAPLAPAFTAVSCTALTLSWPAVPTASTYDLYRAAGTCGAAAAPVAYGISATSYEDTPLSPGTSYSYYLVAEGSGCFSAAGPCAAQATLPLPAPPANVVATAGCGGIALTWDPVPGATGYAVYRGSSCGAGSLLVLGAASPYEDTTAFAGIAYSYWVVASTPCGDTAASDCAAAVRPSDLTSPGPPSAGAVGCASLTLTWPTVAGALAYDLYRSAGSCGGSATLVASQVSGQTFEDTGLTPGAEYAYYLVAQGPCAVSSPGACLTVTTLAAPAITLQPQTQTVPAGQSVTLGVAATGAAPLSYQWYEGATGDTSSAFVGATQASLSFQPAASAAYWVRVSNACGTADSASAAVTVCALSCSASATASQSMVPASVGFHSTVAPSSPACGGPVSYDWDFGDGSAHGASASPQHTYSAEGTYHWALTAASGGMTCSENGSVTVWPQLTLSLTASRQGPGDVFPVAYDFSASATGGSGGYTYAWAFGDGATGSGSAPSHTYTAEGTWIITCTVTDSAGHTAVAAPLSFSTYAPLAVTATAAPGAALPGQPMTFGAAATGGDGHYAYAWAFGDGASATGAPASHAYTSPGTYTATVSVTDTAAHSASGSVTVTVWQPLSVRIVRSSGSGDTVPQTYGFTAEAKGGSGTYAYAWSFGDGGTGTGAASTHTFTAPGAWGVSCAVTDGASDTAASNVLAFTLYNPLVMTCSGTPNPVILGNAMSFGAVVTGGSGLYAYAWAFGDGGSGTGASASHTYEAIGTFTASVTVTDTASHTATCDVPVVVKPVPPRITAVQKVAAPLRLKVTGTGFQNGCGATIDGSAVRVVFKGPTSLVLKNLGALVPKGRTVQIVVTNPDGGTSGPFPYTR